MLACNRTADAKTVEGTILSGLVFFLVASAGAQTIVNPNFEANGGGFTVATGWTAFGGNKWEGSWYPDRQWVQGLSDIPAAGICGVYQQVAVTPGATYRLSAVGRVTTTAGEFTVQVGISPTGSTNHANATWGPASSSTSWVDVTVQATASAGTITIFLRANNTDVQQRAWWGLFDNVTLVQTAAPATATPTPGGPTATPTVPSYASGPRKWKLTYVRQIGFYLNQNPVGNHSIENHLSFENGLPAASIPLTNRYNPNIAVFGTTNGWGHNRIPMNPPTNPYDVYPLNPPIAYEHSPDFNWLVGSYGYSGHYSFECHWRLYEHDDSTEHPDILHPVYHYDQTDGLNGPLLQHPPGWETDQSGLAEWKSYQAQTFVIPASINRIITAKGMMTRGYNGGPVNFQWRASIHQNGPNGPQVGPSRTSRVVSAEEFFPVAVHWGIDEVPVTPGQTYAIKFTAPDGGGFNCWATFNNNYPNGHFWNGDTAVPGRDLVAVVIGAKRVKENAPSPTPSGPTPTPTLTWTPGPVPAELINPSFNEGFTSGIANGWMRWIGYGSSTFLQESYNPWIHSPGSAQRILAGAGPFKAGLRQVVAAEPGRRYNFRAWMIRYDAGNVITTMRIGIDPTGGGNLDNVLWGSSVSQPSVWTLLAAEAVAQSDRITVYLSAEIEGNPFGELSCFFDDCALVALGEPIATSTPTITGAVTSTPTLPAGTDDDGDGVPNAAECWPCTDTNRSNLWLADSDGDARSDGQEDTNRNGLRDPGETYTRYGDSDCDGLEDGMEHLLGTNPLVTDNPYADVDSDGLPDIYDPDTTKVDSDGDKYKDGYEASLLGLPAATNPALHPALGDLNRDVLLSNIDSLMIQSVFLHLTHPSAVATSESDLNRDGFVTNVDALIGQMVFLGMVGALPVGPPNCPPF